MLEVLKQLRDNDLFVKPKKCHFRVTEVDFLGMIISHDGIKMDPEKVNAILKLPELMNVILNINYCCGLFTDYISTRAHYSRLRSTIVPSVACQTTEGEYHSTNPFLLTDTL